MAANELTITNDSSGTQSTTQSPQSAAPTNSGGNVSSGSVQPGTTQKILTNTQAGMPLGGSQLTTVDLKATDARAITATVAPPPAVAQTAPQHPVNLVLLGVSGLLIAGAIILFVITQRSVKNTTNY